MANLLKINKIKNNTVHKSAIIRDMHNIEEDAIVLKLDLFNP